MSAQNGEPSNFVLLVNAKMEKGYGLLLDVASLCRDISFVAVASQSDAASARSLAEQRGLGNVTIVPQTDRIEELYQASRVVVVPSYRFVETFSRVCIEAQRFGKPVIGSNVGNVPNLLAQSGTILPEDSELWAAELSRLFNDKAYYAERSAAALANSERYSYRAQRQSILNIERSSTHPLLIGVGSGIGNMIHVGPMIRLVSNWLGRRVDLVVAEDHGNSLFVLQNSRWVNSVFALRQVVLARRYDTIFLTHSFGSARIPFRAGRVIWSRDWDSFTPGHALHETVFNLEAAHQLLGVDYSDQDAAQHYVGDLTYKWPAGNLVGIHGGSKSGFWACKRWPHFAQFAAVLRERGYRVASFGTPEEYVEGTEDMTGGTIEQMARAMSSCSYFVSNDSGVMNIANALGIPLVTIFAPTNVHTRRPLKPSSRSIALEKSCSPCEIRAKETFHSGGCGCIGEISLNAVLGSFELLVVDAPKLIGPVDSRKLKQETIQWT